MKAFNRENLKNALRASISRVYAAQQEEPDLYRNTLDCFSAAIDSVIQDISLDDWLHQEKERQIQKTKQNAIGTLHEDVLGSIDGVQNLAVGNLIDIVSHKHKIIAEIKNKHNTTKGNHKVAIYHDLAKALENFKGYTGYYVEVLPAGRNSYNEPFTPSDNKVKSRVLQRNDIRKIDGRSFYALLTGVPDAIDELYKELPSLVSEIVEEQFSTKLASDKVANASKFMFNFKKAYKV
jgi:hypothetical protein